MGPGVGKRIVEQNRTPSPDITWQVERGEESS